MEQIKQKSFSIFKPLEYQRIKQIGRVAARMTCKKIRQHLLRPKPIQPVRSMRATLANRLSRIAHASNKYSSSQYAILRNAAPTR